MHMIENIDILLQSVLVPSIKDFFRLAANLMTIFMDIYTKLLLNLMHTSKVKLQDLILKHLTL